MSAAAERVAARARAASLRLIPTPSVGSTEPIEKRGSPVPDQLPAGDPPCVPSAATSRPRTLSETLRCRACVVSARGICGDCRVYWSSSGGEWRELVERSRGATAPREEQLLAPDAALDSDAEDNPRLLRRVKELEDELRHLRFRVSTPPLQPKPPTLASSPRRPCTQQ